MTGSAGKARAGRVGRPHGLDGSFYVEDAEDPLVEGTAVTLAGRETAIERRAGTDRRPLVRVRGVSDRDAAAALHGEPLEVAGGALEPGEPGEYLAADLVGCEIEGLGAVRRIIPAPSCDLLEVGDAKLLVPLVSDAVKRIDLDARSIEVDRHFLGLDDDRGGGPE